MPAEGADPFDCQRSERDRDPGPGMQRSCAQAGLREGPDDQRSSRPESHRCAMEIFGPPSVGQRGDDQKRRQRPDSARQRPDVVLGDGRSHCPGGVAVPKDRVVDQRERRRGDRDPRQHDPLPVPEPGPHAGRLDAGDDEDQELSLPWMKPARQ